MGSRPQLDRLESLLRGENDARVVRPPIPSVNPRHDFFGYDPRKEMSVRDLLGHEHFASEPARETRPEPDEGERFYTIGQLAKLLGRKSQSIRGWEQRGVIPPPTHRTRGTGPAAKRLYTQRQVMGMLAIAADENIIENQRKSLESFSRRVHELWEDIG